MQEGKTIEPSKPALKDRKLGDEWKSWDGRIMDPGDIKAGNRLFLTLLFFSIVLIILAAYSILYLITPRLEQYSEKLPHYAFILISFLSGIALLWFLALVVYLNTNKRKFCFCLGNRFFFTLASLSSRIGDKLGISRDKVGHSFIKVSNAITLASLKSKKRRNVLVLLPRCLTKDARDNIISICSRFNVQIRTVSGGEAARQEVKDVRPDAVIGIACERDLVSGIQDVASHIPVFGIPNIRPLGPCKATHIEYEDLEQTLAFVCESANEKEPAGTA